MTSHTYVPLDDLVAALYLRHSKLLLQLLNLSVHRDRLELLKVNDAPELVDHHRVALLVHDADLGVEVTSILDQLHVLLLRLSTADVK